jgi:hypothetical protein
MIVTTSAITGCTNYAHETVTMHSTVKKYTPRQWCGSQCFSTTRYGGGMICDGARTHKYCSKRSRWGSSRECRS